MGRMKRWLDRILGRVPRVTDWDQLEVGPAELAGSVQALEEIKDPVGGTRCVVLEYRAWPPSTTAGVDGAAVVGDRAFQVSALQAVEFLLQSRGRTVLVRPRPGEDIVARHAALEARYGISLRTEVQHVAAGDDVVVRGRVVHVTPTSPHRTEPYKAVLEAESIRLA